MNKLKSILRWLGIIVCTIILAIAMRVFVFAIFTIPTASMEPSIIEGDRIVVNKLVPGPRIVTNFFSVMKGENPHYHRLAGWNEIKRNDVIVFNSPYTNWNKLEIDSKLYYAKRCVAIPGDIFSIEKGIYKVAGVADTLGNYQQQKAFYEIPAKNIDSVIYKCFPNKRVYGWNVKEFGPIYLPQEGNSIKIDSINIFLYKNLIAYETGKNVYIRKQNIFLEDSLIYKYTFCKNYYFVAGDCVSNSQDSRYWGLLPEDHIVGKASFIYKSVNPYNEQTRWERFLKSID